MKIGDRIVLISMPNDPDPLPPGSLGTVVEISQFRGFQQIDIDWDDGRAIMLVCPPDTYTILGEDHNEHNQTAQPTA